MRLVLIAGVLATALAGCQTAQESLVSAEMVCQESGLRPGTAAYRRCTNANYRENRRQSDAAANAAVAGAAAGVIGGAIIGAAASRPYYRRGYYCDAWGCY